MLNRVVKPILQFRNTRWAWTLAIKDTQDTIQRKMLSSFLKLERLPTEALDVFNRRRLRAVSDLAKQHELWGVDHARRVVAWASHLNRPRNGLSLAAILFKHHDASWIEDRRQSSRGGFLRPGTRVASGPTFARWDESVIKASDFLNHLSLRVFANPTF